MCRHNGTKKWRKNLQVDERTSIFVVRKKKNLKQMTTNKNNNPKKYTTMIAIAFITTAILVSITLRIGAMIMENRRRVM